MTRLRNGRRRAFALLGVLIIVMLASMVAMSLLFRMRADEMSAEAGDGSEAAWAAAMSGVEATLQFVASGDPDSLDWLDQPDLFKEHLVSDDGAERWSFSVYSAGENADSVRFGLSDEAGKLNLNDATLEMLGRLPGIKTAQVHALRDFIDADQQPEPEGAEQEYYDTLAIPYSVRNGSLDTVEELLLVRGFTPAIVYGEDANMNCRLDPNEDDGSMQFPPDNQDGVLDRGLRDLVTVSSYELNVDREGYPRTNLNDPSDPLYTNGLPDTVVAYIEAMRRAKMTVAHPAELLGAKGKFKDDKGKDIELESGVDKEELPAVLDLLSTTSEETLTGLININTATAAVLQTIPGIDASSAEAIVSTRRGLTPDKRRSVAWIFQEGVVNAEMFKKMAPYITTRTWQFSFRVIGYGLPSGRYRVLDVIIDTANGDPAVTYLRDITRLGLPFPIKPAVGNELDTSPTKSFAKTEQKAPRKRLPNSSMQAQLRAKNG